MNEPCLPVTYEHNSSLLCERRPRPSLAAFPPPLPTSVHAERLLCSFQAAGESQHRRPARRSYTPRCCVCLQTWGPNHVTLCTPPHQPRRLHRASPTLFRLFSGVGGVEREGASSCTMSVPRRPTFSSMSKSFLPGRRRLQLESGSTDSHVHF